ncbi:aldehyde dehydrogenase family protein [Nocardia rhizosphaerihabitans]|uniref:Aldehyde dehydrogenase n=1 Tax=Nocardia rhizosphaerihabitans TaxID=1691570 RepID=A0ABQ2L243_9NOCA|nr:aldehyde dehydrogenase family protein [Nocardia rhizosphaerihabitans]GGO00105.1 putative aldehyde dehydrogenase [Nocardia rhizosphaerihabitans]
MTINDSPTDLHSAVDAALSDLAEGERVWAATSLTARAELLGRVRELTGQHAEEWVDAAVSYKRLDPQAPLVGEEWISGPYAMAAGAGSLEHSLLSLAEGRSPLENAHFGVANGRTTVRVLPTSVFDSLLLSGFSAEVWLQPGIGRDEAIRAAGLAQLDPTRTHGIGVVLGAGNITSIAPLDVLYELIAHNRVVALKLNPITNLLLEPLTKVLEPLIAIGAVRILTGGADVGEYLVQHPAVAHVHMTGSAATHDLIVWGHGEDAAARKASGQPRLEKPITSELGGVSPTIVLPGHWSKADLRFQADHIATQRLHNGGYNCVAAQAVVISSEWDQKDDFLRELRAAYEAAPIRSAYYPGSDDRVAAAESTYPDAEHFGGRLLLPGLRGDRSETLLHTEYFAPVLGVVELPGLGADFARAAATTANDEFAGTLGVNVIAHPATIQKLGAAFDILIEQLRYGTIAINAWTGAGFLTAGATWGAYPGHTLDDVQSGIGVVHNALLIDRPERTVVRGPFRPAPRSVLHGEWSLTPKPPWFVSNRTAATTGRRLAAFAAAPGWDKLPAIFASALRG